MFASARRTYETGTRSAPSGRELEAAALFKAARQLEGCGREWDEPGRPARLDEALRYNQRLWTFFQGEITREDCPLPVELRRNLLSLSAFVDRRTFEMMAEPTQAGLQALIEIDRNVGEGLAAPPAPTEASRKA